MKEFLNKFVQVQVSEGHRLVGQCKSIMRVAKGYRLVVGNQAVFLEGLSQVNLNIGDQ